jgi:hypothetical protein
VAQKITRRGNVEEGGKAWPGDKEATTIYSNCTTETQLVKEGYPFLVK